MLSSLALLIAGPPLQIWSSTWRGIVKDGSVTTVSEPRVPAEFQSGKTPNFFILYQWVSLKLQVSKYLRSLVGLFQKIESHIPYKRSFHLNLRKRCSEIMGTILVITAWFLTCFKGTGFHPISLSSFFVKVLFNYLASATYVHEPVLQNIC